MKKQNVRTLALIICTFTYLLVGAAVFDALESDYEEKMRKQYDLKEEQLLQHYNISREEYQKLEAVVLKTSHHLSEQNQWRFAGAFYFSTTVITTIGYGHSTPETIGGKLFCMLYASLGIPLCLVMFQSIGERLNTLISWILTNTKKCFHIKKIDTSQTELIIGSSLIAITVTTGGAAAFSYYEGWDYFRSIYYCIITLTTIGFGDYVALQKEQMLQTKPEYVVFSLVFILFGLTVIASSMNLLVLRFLTMNTEDERREELQAQQTARNSLRLEGDVVTTAPNGAVIQFDDDEIEEFPSSEGVTQGRSRWRSWPLRWLRRTRLFAGARRRFRVRRSPGKISHLLPMQALEITDLVRSVASCPEHGTVVTNGRSGPQTTVLSEAELTTLIDQESLRKRASV